MDADPVEIRVLGCLIEKQRTTPDQYPLSLNGLRLACNQATNREPVVDYDEATIREAIDKLSRRGWIRLASGPGSRVAKYRHLLEDALGRVPSQIALLAVLMLRGPQTPGELKQRVERLYPYPSLEDVQKALDALAEAELVERLPRRPGQSQDRYVQLLGGGGDDRGRCPRRAPGRAGAAWPGGPRGAARGAGGRAATQARRALKPLNLGLRFVLELCMLVALGIWGFSENIVLGIAAPLAAAVVWGLWIAPKATRRLRDPVRLALELLLFGAAGVALAAADHPLAAAVFLAAVALSEVLMLAWRQRGSRLDAWASSLPSWGSRSSSSSRRARTPR